MLEQIRASLAATQEYLRSGKTLDDFEREHGIRGKVGEGLLMLDYNQISVKWTEPFGLVCRGLVLDAATFELIALGLHKFFNSGEHYAAPIDWATARAFEKIDGSLLNRFWSPHTNRFEHTTRFQLPENTRVNTVGMSGITWERLIQKCLVDWEPILLTQPKDETWVFEVCSQQNQVVVRHEGFYAKLLAARNIKTLEEIPLDDLPGGPERKPKSYRFANAQEVADFANTFAATAQEGFVVCDTNFNRIKIKSDQYVALHRAKDGLNSIKNLILLARTNDFEEITVHFPEYKPDLELVAGMIEELIARHEEAYEKYKGITSQKEFALEIQNQGLEHTSALFLTRAKKQPSIRGAFEVLDETPFLRIFKDRVKERLGNKYLEEPPADPEIKQPAFRTDADVQNHLARTANPEQRQDLINEAHEDN